MEKVNKKKSAARHMRIVRRQVGKGTRSEASLDQRVSEAVTRAVQQYGEVFRRLAEYDRS